MLEIKKVHIFLAQLFLSIAGRKRREVKGGNSWFHCAVAINLNSTFTSEKEVTAAAAIDEGTKKKSYLKMVLVETMRPPPSCEQGNGAASHLDQF